VVVDGKESLKTKKILIATGSDVISLPGVAVDEKKIVSSTGRWPFPRCLKAWSWWAAA